MSERLIGTDEELMAVLRVLLSEYRERTKAGQAVIFLPWKFVLAREKIEVKDRQKSLMKKTGEKVINFSFEGEEADIDAEESLRMLGVTLYHLVTGKSELTHESFLLDGYRRSVNSSLWPIVQLLLGKKEQDIDKIEAMIDAIGPEEMKADIEPSHVTTPAGTSRAKSVDDITRWLASEGVRIIDHEDAANFWGMVVSQELRIRYREETLREAIQANRNGERWALAYYSGLSLRQMRDKKGVSQSSQPCFWNTDWWVQGREDSWATRNLEPGYYLLNFKGKFANKQWAVQENMISALGAMYERAHETIVSETVISNFGIHGGERLMESWDHWGKETDQGSMSSPLGPMYERAHETIVSKTVISNFGSHGGGRLVEHWNQWGKKTDVVGGWRICVGHFGSDGWVVCGSPPGRSHASLRVVIFRKFDS